MDQILEIRELIILYFKRYERMVTFSAKFLLGIIVYSLIGKIGFYAPAVSFLFKGALSIPLILLLAFSFMVLPMSMSYVLMILYIMAGLSQSLEIAAISGLVLFLILFFYGRIGGKESALILAMILGYYFKLPYAVPLFAGLYMGLSSFIPIVIGVFLWNFFPYISDMAKSYEAGNMEIMDKIIEFSELISYFFEVLKNNHDWLVSAFILSLVFFVVYFTARLSINYSKEVAVLAGALLNIILSIFFSIATGVSLGILSVFFFGILSAGLVLVIRFFDCVLDYERAERVEFEDDENYYYVKVIPKVISDRSYKPKRARRTNRETDKTEELPPE